MSDKYIYSLEGFTDCIVKPNGDLILHMQDAAKELNAIAKERDENWGFYKKAEAECDEWRERVKKAEQELNTEIRKRGSIVRERDGWAQRSKSHYDNYNKAVEQRNEWRERAEKAEADLENIRAASVVKESLTTAPRPSRLQIAAMVLQGILSNPYKFSGQETANALNFTDALIAAEKEGAK